MMLRCKPGDIAIIINDDIECTRNIGRFVKVHDPKVHMGVYGYCWTIVPLSSEGLYIIDKGKLELTPNIQLNDNILHPDKWLKPIRPFQKPIKIQKTTSLITCR